LSKICFTTTNIILCGNQLVVKLLISYIHVHVFKEMFMSWILPREPQWAMIFGPVQYFIFISSKLPVYIFFNKNILKSIHVRF
jgi:hypothetical protein